MNTPQPPSTALAPAGASAYQLLTNADLMHSLDTVATLMAGGKVAVPQHLAGNKGDCFAIALQAMQWQMNPFAVAQKTFLVGGKLGYEAQLVSAAVNNSGLLATRFEFEWFGPWERIVGKFKEIESKTKKDENTGLPKKFIVPAWNLGDEAGLGVKVWATLRGERNPRVLELLMVQARTRNSTLWAEDPKQQLAYLAQKRWARLYAPDVILGVYTPDELQGPSEIHMGPVEEVGDDAAATASAPAQPQAKTYPDADFKKNYVTWAKLIASGKQTWDAVVATAETRGDLTDEQKKALKAEVEEWEKTVTDAKVKDAASAPAKAPAEAQAQTVPEQAAAPAQDAILTLQSLTDKMREVDSLDALYELADRIDALPAEDQETANNVFNQRVAALGG